MDARIVPEKSSGVSRNIMITQKNMFYILQQINMIVLCDSCGRRSERKSVFLILGELFL